MGRYYENMNAVGIERSGPMLFFVQPPPRGSAALRERLAHPPDPHDSRDRGGGKQGKRDVGSALASIARHRISKNTVAPEAMLCSSKGHRRPINPSLGVTK